MGPKTYFSKKSIKKIYFFLENVLIFIKNLLKKA